MKAIKRLFYALGMATLIGFFAILTSYTNEGFLELDLRTMEWLHGNVFLDALSIFGERWMIFVVSLGLMVFLWLKRENYRGMFFVFLTVGAGNGLNELMEYFFVNERPDLPRGLETFGFPSSHAMVGLLFFFTLAYFLTDHMASKYARWLIWLLTVIMVALVGLSRVAGGEHFFSDVLAGWFAGYSWFVAVAVWYEMREYFLRKRHQNIERG
ncbi:phosphatase PAP2 family protein [Planococcus halotolerans]|uniref:Phosphatidylglycerophosphatase n=1 Tax=Planococcus halotolerans TaxID=2233542 RepID=A0A365KRE1_9BACL|nr:phosphatase PAP2 family protein [Planococcus halotolerans]QHJ69319.1 phosphatase PAP2 family protein [Planococcus halotolerans]RAZ75700.1 phosphatidylglycerophosphatase [Planococcus halotolerans]